MYDGQNCQTSYKVTSTLQCKPDDHHIPVVCFKERAGKPGGGKGLLIGKDKSFTLSTLLDEAICYDARGNGGGGATPTLTGDHENRVTDYTAIVCYTATQYAGYTENLPILKASGGDIGGGSEGLIVYENTSENHRESVCE